MRMRYRSLFCLFSVLVFLGSSGCNNGPQLVPVSGQVMIEDKPLKAGFIRILPNMAGKSRAAQGEIGPDGRFTVTTRENGKEIPGTYIGEHAVEISAFEYKNKQKIWYAPYRYADYQTAKLTAKIDGPTDNLQINLVWDNEANRAKGIVVENIQAE